MEHYKDDAGVVFGDVNLREGRVTQSRDGTPQNPGAGGWPTLRYYNADTGPGGAPVERYLRCNLTVHVPELVREARGLCRAIWRPEAQGSQPRW